jgi:hypothetical protein
MAPILDSHELMQIEMASRGCISGTLAQWPHLLSALRKAGKPATKHTLAADARKMACEVLGAPDLVADICSKAVL